MNNITVAGALGRDAELRTTPQGEQVLGFSVADSHGRDKPTIWWNCQLWGKRAGSLAQYLVKGQSVTVTGGITEREWTDKDGQKRKSLEVRVNDVALQGGKLGGESAPRASAQPAKAAAPAGSGFDDMDDDIPFLFNISAVSDTMGHSKSRHRIKHGSKALHILRVNQVKC